MSYTKNGQDDCGVCESESLRRADRLKLELLGNDIEQADDETLEAFRDIEQIEKIMYSRSKGFC
ncbi:MAG: hypothetical protein HRT47_00425 [Candidatus Caenarcaniphilales bacterium]|nr:hypothetical protein [Candidatus Caenarcaniphilales bacterium]